MNVGEKNVAQMDLPAKLALAQQAFKKYKAACFWSLRDDLVVTEQNLYLIVEGLRRHGDREAFRIADKLCR